MNTLETMEGINDTYAQEIKEIAEEIRSIFKNGVVQADIDYNDIYIRLNFLMVFLTRKALLKPEAMKY